MVTRVALIVWLLPNLMLAQSAPLKLVQSEIKFFSKAPLEDVTAVSKAPRGLLELPFGKFAIQVAMKSFSFPNKLMEEHFNENYAESDRFPMATFAGVLDAIPASGGKVTAKGTLTLHGKSQPVTITVTLTPAGAGWRYESTFKVKLADYGIHIPQLMFAKIAEVVEVSTTGTFETTPAK